MADLTLIITLIISILSFWANTNIDNRTQEQKDYDRFMELSGIDNRTQEQKDYDRFMELSGQYDDDEDDIKAHKAWRDRVYKD